MLKEYFPSIDFEHEQHLTSDDILDSLAVVTIICMLRKQFKVKFPVDLMDAKNFESAEAICQTVEKAIAAEEKA